MIEARRLGRDGPELPVVGIGTWRVFDLPPARQPVADEVVRAAFEAGVRVVDSSPMYGRAEVVLSEALGDRRADAFVATKVWTGDTADGQAHYRRQLALFGDHIDLLQVHNLVAWRDHLDWMERERDAGRIDAIQVPVNPRERAAEPRILPLATDLGLGVIAMRPLGEGSLLRRPFPRELLDAGLRGWPEALLRWCLSDPRVTVAIPATTSAEHAVENATTGWAPLDDELRALVARHARG